MKLSQMSVGSFRSEAQNPWPVQHHLMVGIPLRLREARVYQETIPSREAVLITRTGRQSLRWTA